MMASGPTEPTAALVGASRARRTDGGPWRFSESKGTT